MRGRRPEYQPRFSKSDLAEIEKTLRRTSAPYEHVRRAQLAQQLDSNPSLRSVEAANEVGMHVQSVRKWRKRWAREGFSLEDKARSGRPRSFSPSG